MAGGLRDAEFEAEVETAIAGFVDARLRAVDVAPALARVIDAVRDEGQHQEVLTVLLRALMRFLEQNQYVLRARLAQESPEWVPEWVDDRIFARLFTGLRSFLSDLSSDKSHELRQQFDKFLGDYTRALRNDPQRAQTVNNTKLRLLEHPEVRVWLTSLWSRLKASLLRDTQDPDSQLRASLLALTQRVASALRNDATLQRRVDQLLQRIISYVLEHYSTDIAALISSTVSRWDAEETGRRLELQVGRDLQFIRINGTVVGALVGLVIYAAGQLL